MPRIHDTHRVRSAGLLLGAALACLPTSAGASPVEPSPTTEPAEESSDTGVWGALAGNELRLVTSDGSFRGRLLGFEAGQLVVSRHSDGLVVTMPSADVQRVHVKLRDDKRRPMPSKRGVGMIVGGSILMGVSTPFLVAGIAMLVVCPGCTYITGPLLGLGAGLAGGGVGMTLVGVDRRRRWDRIAAHNGTLSARTPMRIEGVGLVF